jgi:predicted transcriptional regulator
MPTTKNRITFQASDEVKDALEECAANREQSVSALIVGILREYLIKEGYIENPKKRMVTANRYKT